MIRSAVQAGSFYLQQEYLGNSNLTCDVGREEKCGDSGSMDMETTIGENVRWEWVSMAV